MAIRVADGLAGELGIDAVSKAARVTLYGPDGNPISVADDASISPGTQQGVIAMGSNYKTAQMLRASSFGTLRTSSESLFLYDSCEGAAVDINKWLQTTATMTITQSAVNGMLFNAGSSVTAAQGAMQTSVRRMPRLLGSPLAFRCRARLTAHFNNNLVELGFGTPATSVATTAGDGAFWRKDGTGQYVPVISVNNSETLGTPIDNATIVAAIPVTNYAIFEVLISDSFATFNIFTNAGVLVASQNVDFAGATPGFAVTHLQAGTSSSP